MVFAKHLLVYVLLAGAGSYAADPQLARDVEALRNSLPLKDPSRPTLTLRLADILFDQGVELGANTMPTENEGKALKGVRRKTLGLYQEALNGTQFHPPTTGALALKIKFQLARLHQELGEIESANKYWKELVEQKELADIRREAALRLAEYYEKVNTLASLKEADGYYILAIELCGGGDVCGYGHYRRAWALRNAENFPAAIEEMQVALFDSKGQPREEAVRDLIVFLAAEKTDGQNALLLVEKLAERLARPGLYQDLAEGFYSAGNRVAGTRVLEVVNQRGPSLAHQIRLLEEFYGLRQWDKFRTTLDQTMGTAIPEGGIDPKTEKILRRLSVQLDGERASRAEFSPEFKSVLVLYMKLFPKNPDQFKMMEGWLAAESDSAAKIKKIDEWVNGPEMGLTPKEQIKLREIRLALAAKAKDSAVVEVESGKLATLVKDPTQIREYQYIRSVALREQGKADEALKLLNTWALPAGPQDSWNFRGGLLIMEMLLEKKDYVEIARVAGEWYDSPTVQAAAKTAKDKKIYEKGLPDLAKIREEAIFESAVKLGEVPAALVTFEKYCLAGKFLPKSCDNGRVLAVKLKSQKSLLTLLKAMGRESELEAEYEAAGFWAEAAAMQEKKLSAKSEDGDYLKVSLLYELGSRFEDRNRLLGDVVKRMKARKSAGPQEEVIFATLKDAKMLGPEALDLPWSEANRLRLANQLELEGKATERTRKELLASTKAAGVAWSRHVLDGISKADVAQRKIGFYGRKGQAKFKQRLAAINALDAAAEKYFAGADTKTRVRIAALLTKSYTDFSKEILDSPIPAEVSAEILAEAKASLTAMTEPFQKKAADYAKIAKDQLAEIASLPDRAALEALLVPETTPEKIVKIENPEPAPAKTAAALSDEVYKRAIGTLHEDPGSPAALTEIKGFYESQGKERLASYFQGRLLQLNGGKEK